jgi:thiamine monophosphate kinase
MATSGGEDFELMFTAPAGLENELDIAVYPIGKIVPGNELSWRFSNEPMDRDFDGYKHF